MCFQKLEKLSNIVNQNSFLNENVPIYTSINDLEVVNLLEKEDMDKVLIEIESNQSTILTTLPEQEEIFGEVILNNQEELFNEENIFD